jgi:hypothetical protein
MAMRPCRRIDNSIRVGGEQHAVDLFVLYDEGDDEQVEKAINIKEIMATLGGRLPS